MHCAFSMWCIAVNMVNPAASLDWLNNSEMCMWFVQYLRFFVAHKHRIMCGGCSLTKTLIVASYVNSLTLQPQNGNSSIPWFKVCKSKLEDFNCVYFVMLVSLCLFAKTACFSTAVYLWFEMTTLKFRHHFQSCSCKVSFTMLLFCKASSTFNLQPTVNCNLLAYLMPSYISEDLSAYVSPRLYTHVCVMTN